MSIETLPAEVIDLIAAGEVIDSLLAVVRELVENALDAKATRVSVSLYPELWQVQVADNGRGMSLEDLKICASPHSTSKIRNSKDLWHITSLGFRGEALHSISQVADLAIYSRLKGRLDAVGWKVDYQQGTAITEEAIAIAPGTIVTASNIFGQLPVRRRGLPAPSRQLKAVQRLIQHLALCHPEITWQVKQNDRVWFHLSSGNNAQQVLPQFLRKVSSSDLQYLRLIEQQTTINHQPEYIHQPATIELILGLPDRLHRYKADWIKVAVNGRVVHCPELEQVIIAGMARTLPRDRYPVAFLHLHLDPSGIDWNRHPAKAEIYLHSLEYWQERVSDAIAQALKLNNSSVPQTFGDRRIQQVLKAAEATGNYEFGSSSPDQKSTNEIGSLELKAIAQVNKTYIVAEHSYGMWLIEQHIAHERILYEQLQDEWQIIPLDTPIVLNNLQKSQIEQLQQIGIDIEPFGEGLWTVRNAPEALATREDCQDALLELSWGGDLQTAQVATACRTAIRNGTELNLKTMQNILDRWQNTRNPRTCPHGRPIYLSLEETTLSRFFRRHWVIGKSHGI
ncbi:DNA mismatch repair protein MutL [Hyella patelloides LEGE 07179]|uniref:DNA mismatch repair protein MutL n=1 Tax=Hyella patelloides LEGE 07179 TaxID=945734 RepID=A0A563VKC7_9CYAN|nr:DNA mismatch repair endonuclease MutL [Hyella patelloides]VEP11862.1 DNA mismatch repair protein MutL [Hyella patelloides LEGE 07179]